MRGVTVIARGRRFLAGIRLLVTARPAGRGKHVQIMVGMAQAVNPRGDQAADGEQDSKQPASDTLS